MKDTRTRQCVWCGRTLPIDEFPLKVYPKHSRKRMCRECLEVGHSCLKKERPPKPVLTESEKAEAKREYMRRWRSRNKDRINQYNRKYRNDGAQGPTRPKAPSGTSPRYEYHRKWREAKKEQERQRAEQAAQPKPKLCLQCINYPCFTGIETLDSDFAKEGCHQFRVKQTI